jgi:hypothetical protein
MKVAPKGVASLKRFFERRKMTLAVALSFAVWGREAWSLGLEALPGVLLGNFAAVVVRVNGYAFASV